MGRSKKTERREYDDEAAERLVAEYIRVFKPKWANVGQDNEWADIPRAPSKWGHDAWGAYYGGEPSLQGEGREITNPEYLPDPRDW
jgi:hypothetical protein